VDVGGKVGVGGNVGVLDGVGDGPGVSVGGLGSVGDATTVGVHVGTPMMRDVGVLVGRLATAAGVGGGKILTRPRAIRP
jgi:hypothetical protein